MRTRIAAFLTCLLVGVVALNLNVHPVFSSSTIYIRADGSIDPPSAPILTTDNIIYTLVDNIYDEIVVEKNDIVIDGASYTVEGTRTGNGFTLYSVANVTLTNINIKNFAYGVYLESSSYNSIHRNIISGNDYDGIEVYFSSDYNNITENRIEANGWFGIAVHYSNNNTINANEIAGNDDGIDAYDASGTEISRNNITGNGEFGIGLYSSSNNNIFLNNFFNNTQHVYSEYSTNRWDNGYPSGGNYWSNHTGSDTYRGPGQNEIGSDGIVDIGHQLDSQNRDNYPLTKRYYGPHDLGIKSITCSKTILGQDEIMNITIRTVNSGTFVETSQISLSANSTLLSQQQIAVTARNSISITVTWNTTGFLKGKHTLTAQIVTVPGEADTSDNTLATTIIITIQADINGDGVVDIYDAIILAGAYSSTSSSSNWNANADINSDNIIDIYDAIILAKNYGKKSS